ncbi:MAG: hypothetical protein R3A52_23745 [Polyangiales bacterium]
MRARSCLPWVLAVASLGCVDPRARGEPSPALAPARLRAFGSADAVRAWLRALPPEAQVYFDGVTVEVCNGVDDNCNGAVGPSAQRVVASDARATWSARASAWSPSPTTGAQGVDEGDIVKVHGDHLVVLRRGRLFSVRAGDGALTPVSAVDAFGRGRARAPRRLVRRDARRRRYRRRHRLQLRGARLRGRALRHRRGG